MMQMLYPKSQVANPKSPIGLRHGISLVEVLISMFVLLIGLMGVAAMFPVGSYYMVKGEQRDRAAALAQSAANEMVTRGFLAPETWLQYSTNPIPASQSHAARAFPIYPPPDQTSPPPQVGYVIDPLGAAEAASQGDVMARVFPRDDSPRVGSPLRVTLPVQINNDVRMPLPIADLIFRSRDDLVFALPDQDDLPARLLFDDIDHDGDSSTPAVPVRRQTLGEYSWLVTVGPCYSFESKYQWTRNSNRQFNYLATGRDPSLEHKVSVVVFHKRDFLFPTGSGGAETELNERQVTARVLSSGSDGGEVRLETNDPRELNGMRAGEWVLMFGQYPLTRNLDPEHRRWFMEWYQIVAMDLGYGDAAGVAQGTRIVSLKGPAWPYTAEDLRLMNEPNFPETLLPRVGLVKGAISVHSKTMRLESPSAWSIP